MEQGRRIGGRRPFGYEADGLTVRESEAEHVRRAYEGVLAGVPVATVARALTEAGVPTSQGSAHWHPSTLRDMLLNPRYAGLRGHGSVPERGRRTIDVHGPAVWPGLVPESTWQATKDLLTAPGRRTPPRGGTAFLTGWCVCGVCGAHVHGGRESASARRTIRCSAVAHLARRAEPVEQYVTAALLRRLARADAADLMVGASRDTFDADALRVERTALRGRLDEAAGLFARGAVTAVQLERITADVQDRLAALDASMAEAGRVDLLGPLVAADDVHAAWDALVPEVRRRVAATLVDVVIHPPGRGVRTFDPATVEVTWKPTN
ncbi:recombinase family protein [Kineosporia sp. A_224]|uniref:recombinase family protein n=1 Tax=Kineosporia sp. A_224 TaxID=1962180 RepID=UPI0021006FCA|nr:recombinase family protein [Kineosporia sp. A_224]